MAHRVPPTALQAFCCLGQNSCIPLINPLASESLDVSTSVSFLNLRQGWAQNCCRPDPAWPRRYFHTYLKTPSRPPAPMPCCWLVTVGTRLPARPALPVPFLDSLLFPSGSTWRASPSWCLLPQRSLPHPEPQETCDWEGLAVTMAMGPSEGGRWSSSPPVRVALCVL